MWQGNDNNNNNNSVQDRVRCNEIKWSDNVIQALIYTRTSFSVHLRVPLSLVIMIADTWFHVSFIPSSRFPGSAFTDPLSLVTTFLNAGVFWALSWVRMADFTYHVSSSCHRDFDVWFHASPIPRHLSFLRLSLQVPCPLVVRISDAWFHVSFIPRRQNFLTLDFTRPLCLVVKISDAWFHASFMPYRQISDAWFYVYLTGWHQDFWRLISCVLYPSHRDFWHLIAGVPDLLSSWFLAPWFAVSQPLAMAISDVWFMCPLFSCHDDFWCLIYVPLIQLGWRVLTFDLCAPYSVSWRFLTSDLCAPNSVVMKISDAS